MSQNEFIAVNCVVAFVNLAAIALEVRHLPFKSNWSIGCNIMTCCAQVLTAVFWTQSPKLLTPTIFLEAFLVDFVFAQNAIILNSFSSFNESGCRKAKLAAWGLSGFDSALNLGLGIAALCIPHNKGFGMVTLIKTILFALVLAVQTLGYSIWIISKLFKVRNTVLPNGDRIDRMYLQIWMILVTFVFVDSYFELNRAAIVATFAAGFPVFLGMYPIMVGYWAIRHASGTIFALSIRRIEPIITQLTSRVHLSSMEDLGAI